MMESSSKTERKAFGLLKERMLHLRMNATYIFQLEEEITK